MSIAAGLSFTGCGNSSNSGSTGPTFEQVPLIGEGYALAAFQGINSDQTIATKIRLHSNGKLDIFIGTVTTGDQGVGREDFIGSGIATQLFKNKYRITGIELTSNTCKMTCNELILTIPEDKLQDYRKGEIVNDATLEVDFTHEHQEGASPCPLNKGKWEIKDTMTGQTGQVKTTPSGTP